MKDKQTLFSATFEESQNFVPNMFTNKPYLDNLNILESNNLFKRLGAFFLILIFFTSQFWIYGILLPNSVMTVNPGEVHYLTVDMLRGMYIFRHLKWLIIVSIIIMLLCTVINILPVKNYAKRRQWAVLVLLFIVVSFVIAIMPIGLGITLGAWGWIGFIISNLYGIVFFLKKTKDKINDIKDQLYGANNEKNLHQLDSIDSQGIDKLWSILKKCSILAVIIIIANVYQFRIGIAGEYTIWSIVGIGTIVYWAIVTVGVYAILPTCLRTFYFVKYDESYRQLWHATDEQWYGKRKAKKLAKKEQKKNN